MDIAVIRTKLSGTGMKLLDGIDPNKDNYVCAGIIHTRTQQIGCLLRLEPNRQAQVRSFALMTHTGGITDVLIPLPPQMYRLTIRSSKDAVARQICDLLCEQF